MILEWLQSKTWRASEHAKNQGYLNQLIALNARRNRLKKSWQNHEQTCQQIIKKEILLTPHRHSVVVLGSGLLHEIPIHDLMASFKEVHLIDMVHGPRAYQFSDRVHLQIQDVTGFWSILNQFDSQTYLSHLESLPCLWPQADLVISANLLSQIPISFVPKMQELGIPNDDQVTICETLLKNHIHHLKQNSGRSLLITDIGREFLDPSHRFLRKEPTLIGLNLGKAFQSWNWDLAPIPEVSVKEHMRLMMGAWHIKI